MLLKSGDISSENPDKVHIIWFLLRSRPLIVAARRRAWAAALGCRSRVKTPFLLPPTRMIPEVVVKSAKFHVLADDRVDAVENPMIHVQVFDLVLLTPRVSGNTGAGLDRCRRRTR